MFLLFDWILKDERITKFGNSFIIMETKGLKVELF